MDNKPIRIGRAVSGVVVITLIAKLLGFLREVLLSKYFGATGISDAYLISQNIPGTIFDFVGTGLATSFMPIYYKILDKAGKKEAVKFTNYVINITLIFSLVVIVLVYLFTPAIIKIFASGFEGQTLKYAEDFTRINIISLIFSTYVYVFTSYLQANKIFTKSAFAAIPNSICIMLAIVLGAKVNVYLLSIGSALAVLVQSIFLFVPAVKAGYRPLAKIKWNDSIKEFFRLLLPVIFGVSVNQINTLVDRTVASQVAVGGISALTYANSLIMLVQGGIVQPISTVFYPQITENVTSGDKEKSAAMVERAINFLLSILIPITFGFMAFRTQITDTLFHRGAFDENATNMTASALMFYAIGICFVGIRELISRYYYANSNTVIPMRNATIGVIVNIVLNLLFAKFFGISGLAMATSISAIVTAILLWTGCKKSLGTKLKLKYFDLLKVFITSFIMIIGTLLFSRIVSVNKYVDLLMIILIGVLIYFCVGYLLHLELIFEIIHKIIKRFHIIKE